MANHKYSFEDFLITIDKTGQTLLIKELFGSRKNYIDTPGYYWKEKDDYSDVFEFYEMNMGSEDYTKLMKWWENHPRRVNKFMELIKKR